MTYRAPQNAEVILSRSFESAELRALRAQRHGRTRLLLEVNTTALAQFFGEDEDRHYYRCSEWDSEAELLSAFERASTALAH